MKASVYILFLSFFFFCSTLSGYSQKQDDKVETKMFVIKGDNDWLKTNILLRPQDRVEIKATGQVFFSDGVNLSGVTPAGMSRDEYDLNWEIDSQYCDDPEMEFNHAALIGRVNNNTFLIGKNKTIAGKKGSLVLGINDCTFKNKFFNTGEFKVTVKVHRGK